MNGVVGAYFALALVQHSDHPDTQRIPLLLHDVSDSDKKKNKQKKTTFGRETDRGRTLHAGICTHLPGRGFAVTSPT